MTTIRESTAEPVGVVGLGIMGGAIARNLLAGGFDVTGYDIDAEALATFLTAGGSAARSPAEVARACALVITSLPSAGALHEVIQGPGGLSECGRAGLCVLETSTLALADKEAAKVALEAHGADMLDCPISGTGAQAANRDIVFLASGDPVWVERARPVLLSVGRSVHNIGPFGAGSKLKFVANLLVAVHNTAAAEAFVLAEKAGLDPATMFEALYDSAASSRVFQLRTPMMIANRYSPPTARVSISVKDLALIDAYAQELDSPTPLLTVVRSLYETAMSDGLEDLDSAAVCIVLERMGAVERTVPTVETQQSG